MRTSTPQALVYAAPPSARKSPYKRRRLNQAIDSGCQPGRALTDNSNVALAPNAPSLSVCAKLSCSTCHRALSTAIRPGVAGPPMCSRCSAPTCAICARTCTSYTLPPSSPPTPALTHSSSPSTYATPSVSPKRAALSLSYAVMNCDASVALAPPSVPSVKRKKAPIDKEDVDGDGNLDGNTTRNFDAMPTDGQGAGTESVIIPGCGRVVCRACCKESPDSDGKLCLDCFAFV